MKKLGFGLTRLPLTGPDDDSGVDMEAVGPLVDTFMAKGFTYFDAAAPYHGGSSEVRCPPRLPIRQYLEDVTRVLEG